MAAITLTVAAILAARSFLRGQREDDEEKRRGATRRREEATGRANESSSPPSSSPSPSPSPSPPSLSVIVAINMQHDFLHELEKNELPDCDIHVGRLQASQICDELSRLLPWFRLQQQGRSATTSATQDPLLHFIHTKQTHSTQNKEHMASMRAHGGVHCVKGTKGWLDAAPLSPPGAPFGCLPNETTLEHDGLLHPRGISPTEQVRQLMREAGVEHSKDVRVAVVGVWPELVLHMMFDFQRDGFTNVASCQSLIATNGDGPGNTAHIKAFFGAPLHAT